MADEQYHPEEILKLEFDYANKTAEQAQDDRATIINLYLLLVGGVGSITAGLGQELPRGVYVLVFGLLGVTGFFTLMKLIRLRQAWYDSVLAMNQIKDFYVGKFTELEQAFRWRTKTIPPPDKVATITFNLSLLVSIIDSVALGAAVFFSGVRLANNDYLLAALVAVLFLFWQIWFYFFQLREK